MALDKATIAMIRTELDEKLTDGRVEKIQQPEKDLLIITIRSAGENYRLLIRSAGPNARIHLTERSFENPMEAPMFCMLLRKHLLGARIREISQPNRDRLILFTLENRNELGDTGQLTLSAEFLGRASNVILVDQGGRILDCIHRIGIPQSGGRGLLPGLRYELPRIRDVESPQDAETADNSAYISSILDRRFAALERQELQKRRTKELVKTIRRARDRQLRKLVVQTEELKRSENMETVRQQAELLQANLWRVKKGDRTLRCENYYEPEEPTIELELDPLILPQQNLEKRFREYKKLKGAREHLRVIIEEGEQQLDYLNSVLEELSRAETDAELREIRAELQTTGWLKRENGRKEKLLTKGATPLRFETCDGFEILVGRSNTQNDELTTKTARRTDLWFHVKELHGSHVILRCKGMNPSKAAIEEAARYAVRYSQAKNQGKTAVDYTMVRNVKKPSGALPGKVIYRDYQTILVDDDSEQAENDR